MYCHPAGASWKKQDPGGEPWLCQRCPTCNNAFHGLIEHMGFGPNSFVGSVCVLPFQDSAHIHYMNWNGGDLGIY